MRRCARAAAASSTTGARSCLAFAPCLRVAHASLPALQPDINTRLAALVHSAPVMLFMKGAPPSCAGRSTPLLVSHLLFPCHLIAGSPGEPKCGFSRKVVEALGGAGCTSFGHFDILGDAAVREGLKAYSNWPTYPQLYVAGELIGGCDIVLEMAANGELKTTIDKAATAPAPAVDDVDARIRKLLASAPVMLFMKGASSRAVCSVGMLAGF